MQNNTFLVRNLVPKSYHFDGYNELKCPNSRDRPFFKDNTIEMGNYFLSIRLEDSSHLSLNFESVCKEGNIKFKPYYLSLEDFVLKLKKSIQDGSDFITFEIIPEYFCDKARCIKCPYMRKDCKQLTLNRPKKIYAAISFNSSEVKEALTSYFNITNLNGGNTTMKKKNNLMGMNLEYGVCKDSNIASTLMGVAVRNKESGSWYTFDAATNSLKNLANFKMGNFPIFMLPVTTLTVGDLIKLNGGYYYVKSINANNTFTLIDAATGIIQERLPEANILLNMTMYTKLVAFDAKTLTDTSSNQNIGNNVIAAICMMNWSQGNTDEFSLDNISNDSFNGFGEFLPLLLASGNSALGGIFGGAEGGMDISKLMLLGAMSGDEDTNGFGQMMVLSTLLGANNPMAPITNAIPGVLGAVAPAAPVASEAFACEACGKEYPAGTNFCSDCGGKVVTKATVCPKCKATVGTDDAFCSNCGANLKKTTCSKCGKEVDPDAKFCSGCGNNLTAAPVAPSAPVTEATETVASEADK